MTDIILTTGCYDGPTGLHRGHKFYFQSLHNMFPCAQVVILVNTDTYILKHKKRSPLCNVYQRIIAIRQYWLEMAPNVHPVILPMLDFALDDNTKVVQRWIEHIKPTHIVVGRGYMEDQVVSSGRERIVLIEEDIGVSTTGIIEQLDKYGDTQKIQ